LSNTSMLNLLELNNIVKNLKNDALDSLSKEGFNDNEIKLFISFDLRYVNQAYEIEVPVDSIEITNDVIKESIRKFNELHNKTYGFSRKDEVIELVNVRMQAIGLMPEINYQTSNES